MTLPTAVTSHALRPMKWPTGEMFEAVGVAGLDQLIDETVPSSIRQETPLSFGNRNQSASFCGICVVWPKRMTS